MIEGIGQEIRSIVDDYAMRFFEVLSTDLAQGLYLIAALIALVLIVNYVLQLQQFTFGAFFGWILRTMIITAAATSAAFFIHVYVGVTTFPDAIASRITGGETVLGALDAAVMNAMDRGAEAVGEGSVTSGDTWGIALAGIFLWGVGALLGAIGIVVVSVAYAGSGIAMGLAPIFISALILPATANLFGSWVKFTLGFAFIQILLAGILGVVTEVLSDFLVSTDTNADLETIGGFAVAILVSIVLTSQIPAFASALAGTVVVAGTGFAQAAGIAHGFRSFMQNAADSMNSGYTRGVVGREMWRAGANEKGIKARGQAAWNARREIMGEARAQSPDARIRGAARSRRDRQRPPDTDRPKK